jgi:hypothetical protein
MLIYLDHAIAKRRTANHFNSEGDLIEAIEEGAVLRVRPKAMTVTVIIGAFFRSCSAVARAPRSCAESQPPWSAV